MEFRVKFIARPGFWLVHKTLNLGLDALDIARGKLEASFPADVFAKELVSISTEATEMSFTLSEYSARKSGCFKDCNSITLTVVDESFNRFIVVDYIMNECHETNAVTSVDPFMGIDENKVLAAWLGGEIRCEQVIL